MTARDHLQERLRRLPPEQLAALVEELLDRLSTKERLEFVSRLPAIPAEELARHLPYDSDQAFLDEIEEFCERVRSREFVETSGYDPEEREYHGFGDDSWIEEMSPLFEDTEAYFLARHHETVEAAYRMLFDCLLLQGDGEDYFTTSRPQEVLGVNLTAARNRFFDTLRRLYTGDTLARKIIEGLEEYRFIGRDYPTVQELFPEGGEVIDLLEQALIRDARSSSESSLWAATGPFAPLLRQIYAQFRSLEQLDQLAQHHGERHRWCYLDLARAYAENGAWDKVLDWTRRGLGLPVRWDPSSHAQLADYQAHAAEHLGDPAAALAARWDAFTSQVETRRFVELRRVARAQGEWAEYAPRVFGHLQREARPSVGEVGFHVLVEALLVEGQYRDAVKRVTPRSVTSVWELDSTAFETVIDFLAHSATRAYRREALAAHYPEITRRLNTAHEIVQLLHAELPQEGLSQAERDQQIEAMIGALRARIDTIVSGKHAGYYEPAAHDAVLVEELYRLQSRSEEGQRFLVDLLARYPRHRNFRAELKKLAPIG